jgi:hypothetical protein
VKGADFQKHGKVPRPFRTIIQNLVHILATFLMRWKCVECGTTFRHFPPGVAPPKRYLPDALLPKAKAYIEEPLATYRQVVKAGGVPLRYVGVAAQRHWSEAQKRREETRALAHATIWRWITTLAKKRGLFQKRIERMQSAAGQADLSPWLIQPQKYRSEERRQILVHAAQVLEVLFREKYPTGNETLYSGP